MNVAQGGRPETPPCGGGDRNFYRFRSEWCLVYRANQAAMMRHGRAGLAAHLRRLPDALGVAGVSI